ncbi:MAG: AAA domain-containing protein [bacterium]
MAKYNNNQNREFSKYSGLSNVKLKEKIHELLPKVKPFSSVSNSTYLDFFQAGIEYEIRLVEEDEREQIIALFDGRIITYDSVTTIRFKTEEILMLMVDSPIKIMFSNSTQLEATFIGQDPVNMTVDLTVEGAVPEGHLDKATITSSSSALLKRLAKRIFEWDKGELERAPNLAPALFNGIFQKTLPSTKCLIPKSKSLNECQKEALLKTGGDGIVLIWGPPGTGKTTVLSLSIVNAIEQNKRVLLASNTNKAIDHALGKVVDHIEENSILFPNAHKQLRENLLLRFREVRTDNISEKLNEKVSLKSITNRKTGNIHEQINDHRQRLSIIETNLRKISSEIINLQGLKRCLENQNHTKISLEERKTWLNEKESLKNDLYGQLTTITTELSQLELEVSKLKTDEKKYSQFEEAYHILSKAQELRQLITDRKEKEEALKKLIDRQLALERYLKNELPVFEVLSEELSKLDARHKSDTASITLHGEIVELSAESIELDGFLKRETYNLEKSNSDISDIEKRLGNNRTEKDELNKTAFSRLRNRSVIKGLDDSNNDLVQRKEQLNIDARIAEKKLMYTQKRVAERKSVIFGLIIADKQKIKENLGIEYSPSVIERLQSSVVSLKQDMDGKKIKLEESQGRIKQVKEALPHLQNLVSSNQSEINKLGSDAEKLKSSLRTAMMLIRENNLSTDVTQGLKIVNNQLRRIEENRFKIKKHASLQGERKSLIEKLKEADSYIDRCKKEIVALSDKSTEIDTVIKQAEEKWPGINIQTVETLLGEEKQKVQSVQHEITNLNDTIKELEFKLSIVEKTVLKESRLVVTTLTLASISTEILNEKFDCIYIDEMSMCLAPQIYIAAAAAKNTVVISGDHAQLPAITKGSNPAGFGVDLFSRLGIGAKSAERQVDCCFLQTQYRFSSEIMHIPNYMHFYPDDFKLKHNEAKNICILSETRKTKLFDGQTTAVIDTSLAKPESQRISHSVLCPYHAFLDLYIVEKLMEEGFCPTDIAIITPYRVQAEFIMALMKKCKNKLDGLVCSTVHRLQGDERKIIICDIPNSHGSSLDGIRPTPKNIRNEFPPIEQDRKFNVAITRTQNHFVFVGNINYLMTHGESKGKEKDSYEDSVYRRYLLALRNSGVPHWHIDAAALIDPEAVEEIKRYSRRRIIPDDPPKLSEEAVKKCEEKIKETDEYEFKLTHILREEAFYGFIGLDLEKVKNRLIIVSPFISVNRIRWYEEFLVRLRDKNVEITVYTKPLDEELSEWHKNGVKRIKNIGINVEFLRRIHSKFIGIDDDICYEGSMNPLSHRDTSEIVNRFKGAGCVDAYMTQIMRSSVSQSYETMDAKVSLSEIELKNAMIKLRGRIIGEKGGQPQFVLSNSKIDALINDLPLSKELFLAHPSIRNNNFRVLLEDYADDFVQLFIMGKEGQCEKISAELEKKRTMDNRKKTKKKK